jgi:hypothetical protein
MDNERSNILLGRSIYSITNTGFIILYDSNFNYVSSEEVMNLIRKYGKVILSDDFNAPIPFIVDGVTMLICGQKFNYPLDNLPCSLRVLQIGAISGSFISKFYKSLKSLPHGLEDLRLFAVEYHHVITEDIGIYLPSTLKYLYLNITGALDINQLPDSVEEIYINLARMHLADVFKIPTNLKLFCGDYADLPFCNELQTKFPHIEVKTTSIFNQWLQFL